VSPTKQKLNGEDVDVGKAADRVENAMLTELEANALIKEFIKSKENLPEHKDCKKPDGREIAVAITTLMKEVNRLIGYHTDLVRRLEPVMTQPAPTEKIGDYPATNVALANVIYNAASQIRDTADSSQTTLNRLAI
jgi:hypothetical protein